MLCDALARIGRGAPDSAAYFRLSSRPLDQEPFAVARVRHGEAELRRLVLAAAHWPYVSSRPRWRWPLLAVSGRAAEALLVGAPG